MKNTRFALVVLLIVCSADVNGASKYVQKKANKDIRALEPFTLDEFVDSVYSDTKWNGKWLDDENFMYKKGGVHYEYNAPKGKADVLIAEPTLKPYNGASVKISKDKQYFLIKYNVAPVFRHSTLANYAIGRVSDQKTWLFNPDKTNTLYQYCQFSPNNNTLVAVQGNDIYYYPNITDFTKGSQQITKDGSASKYNGVPDWTYEEEVFSSDSALWMSPYSDSLIYAQFNDDKVAEFSYYKYGKPGTMESQYPQLIKVNYPKAGARNPTFTVHSYNIASQNDVPLSLSFDSGSTSENYVLYDVTWKNKMNVYVTFTNRRQNIGKLMDCDVNTGRCKLVDNLKQTKGWLEILPPHFMDNESRVSRDTSTDYDDLIITKGTNFENLNINNKMITKIYGHNKSDTIFFEATDGSNHSQQHVYAVNAKTKKNSCLTCEFMVPQEGKCKYAKAEFSTNMQYMTRICLGPGPAFIDILNLQQNKSVIFEDNQKVRDALKKKAMPIIKDLTIDIPNTKYKAAVRLLLPPNFVETHKYPMLVNVYGGPNSNQISDAYSIGLQHYLVTNKSYIYAFIDGRGSGKRGRNLMHEVYLKLGQFEIDDQISTTKKLRDTYKYIDGSRIGIWGWSYGGFATAWATARDNGTFSCGVSVAPVTSFIYYDSIYTERYMDIPSLNEVGYNKTDVTRVAESFRGKNFLLVHGNADDNVHYQQGMMLARSLELADVPFEIISYPDENHSLGGVTKHLYHALDAFWDKHFNDVKINTSRAANGIHSNSPRLFLLVLCFIKFLIN